MLKRSIVWFRNDLRLHDNEALLDAIKHNEEIIPVYVIDPRIFRSKTKYGFNKTDKFRSLFLLESIRDLRNSLQNIGSNLYVFEGYPEEIISTLAWDNKTSYVYCNRERTDEEVKVQDALERKLWTMGQEMRFYRGKMLYYTADLPFPITQCPDQFTAFRKEVEKFVKIREPLSTPEKVLNPLSVEIDEGAIPSIEQIGYDRFEVEKGIALKGGETASMELLKNYVWETGNIKDYKERRNELLGMSFSSKLSAYLSAGCISPKMIYKEVQEYKSQNGDHESAYSLIFELFWRDFFRFMGKKHGNKIFQLHGFNGQNNTASDEDLLLFDKWKNGMTGIPFVDANMRELNATGFMSNRGRQNVASFLVKDLKLNWLLGAEYFESLLIDYDPCSNYGNWNYIAGVGSDPRPDRYFNISAQARKYDSKAEYMLYWLPELKDMDQDYLFNPYAHPELKEALPASYPAPCISHISW